MVIWFAVASVLLVAIVFRSPGIDYRSVIVGSLLPGVEVLFGGPRVLHSLLGAVLLLVVVMAATRHRRLVRRRLLGVPIGMMAHLVLDGAFATTAVFWWPLLGWEPGADQLPEWSHLGLSLVLEVAGIALGVWAWRLFGLDDPARRERFVRDGRLELPS